MNVEGNCATSTLTFKDPENIHSAIKSIFEIDRKATSTDTNYAKVESFPNLSLDKELPRDKLGGKLTFYAALGDESDLEAYERYLQSKRSQAADQRDDSETVSMDAFASLTRLKREGKKATLQRLSESTNQCEDVNSQIRASSDLPREEIRKQRLKWIQPLSRDQKDVARMQKNTIQKWKQVNEEWEQFKTRMAKKLQKPTSKLVINRMNTHREKVELHEALEIATPFIEKVGSDLWSVSLRNDATRYVPVGNIFSGLWCPIRERTTLGPSVRRPLDHTSLTSHFSDQINSENNDSPMSILDNRMQKAVTRKKKKLKKQLEKLLKHTVEPSKSGRMVVGTMDLFEWAHSSKTTMQSESSYGLNTPQLDMVEDEVDHKILDSDSKDFQPSLHLYVCGSEFKSRHMQLEFYTDCRTLETQTVVLENAGSVAYHFEWFRDDIVADTDVLHHLKDNGEQSCVHGVVHRTFISCMHGLLLPDECIEFTFFFRASTPGMYLENWSLTLDPPLVREVHDSTNNKNPLKTSTSDQDYTILGVSCCCIAVDNDVPIKTRQRLRDTIDGRATMRMAQQLIYQILDSIKYGESSGALTAGSTPADVHFQTEHKNSPYESLYCYEDVANKAQSINAAIRHLHEDIQILEKDKNVLENVIDENGRNVEGKINFTDLGNKIAATEKSLQSIAYFSVDREGTFSDESSTEEEERSLDHESSTGSENKDNDESLLHQRNLLHLEIAAKIRRDFESLVREAMVSPDDREYFHRQLSNELSKVLSEVPVVDEIVKLSQYVGEEMTSSTSSHVYNGILAAVEKAVRSNRTHQLSRHTQLQRLQNGWPFEASHFTNLVESSIPHVVFNSTEGENAEILFENVQLITDLDIANWFGLKHLQTDQKATSPAFSFQWKVNPELANSEKYIPREFHSAATSICDIIQWYQLRRDEQEKRHVAGSPLRLLVMSELSSPPMLNRQARREFDMACASGGYSTEVYVDALIATQDDHLSLEDCASIFERALKRFLPRNIQWTFQFCQTIEEVESIPEPMDRKSVQILLLQNLHKVTSERINVDESNLGSFEPVGSHTGTNDLPHERSIRQRSSDTIIFDTFPSKFDRFSEEEAALSPRAFLSSKLHEEWKLWLHSLTPQSVGCMETRNIAIIGGRNLSSKIHLIDTMIESSKEIYFVGKVAIELYCALFLRQRHLRSEELIHEAQRRGRNKSAEKLRRRMECEEARDLDAVYMIPAVNRLQQKAYCRDTQLWLPRDWIVGEEPLPRHPQTSLRDRVLIALEDDIVSSDGEDMDDEDSNDDDEAKEIKKSDDPVKSPPRSCAWEPFMTYEGETAHVVISSRGSKSTKWISFEDVTEGFLCDQFQAINESQAEILEPKTQDEEDDSNTDRSIAPKKKVSPPRYEWIFRAYDVGPQSMDYLCKYLQEFCDTNDNFNVFINGVCGVVEYREFSLATRQFLSACSSLKEKYETINMFVAGHTTAKLLQWLDSKTSQSEIHSCITIKHISQNVSPHSSISGNTIGAATIMKQILSGRTNHMITSLRNLHEAS